MSIFSRIKSAFNAFRHNEESPPEFNDIGPAYYSRPDRRRFFGGNERSIITSVYNRIAVDAAAIDIQHVKLDSDGCYQETLNSTLNQCLALQANIDQTGRAFIQDIVQSLVEEGSVAVVPVDTDRNPDDGSFHILTLRVGKILEWYPLYVRVRLYNELTGHEEDILVAKETTAIIENPFYAIMNEPSSTMKRLSRKLAILDVIDEQSGSGKLDLLIQLPYSLKTEVKRQQAEERLKDIEGQLQDTKYGIAYIDATEHITQLNRPVENNILKQVEYLTSMLYSQLGLTQEIMNGTADATAMLNYYNRTIEPIISAIVEEFQRKFLSQTARTQGQAIKYFRDPFKLIPIDQIADMADKFTRNEILSSNEIRQIIGRKPSNDPSADELRNKNIAQPASELEEKQPETNKMEEIQNGKTEV